MSTRATRAGAGEQAHRARLLVWVALAVGACERPAEPPAPPAPTPPPAPKVAPTAPAAEPWQMRGTLLGVSGDRAIVRADRIQSVDIDSGEVQATAATMAEDPVPSFERLLPRLGESAERETVPVDRLDDTPVWVAGGAVLFLRGTEQAVTSLVGLDASTLEVAWTVGLAQKRPLGACATSAGILLVPQRGEPVRFVDWAGQQRWLRELGEGDEEIVEFACGDDRVVARLKSARGERLRTFDAAAGDLMSESKDIPEELASAVGRQSTSDPRVRQVGEFVEGRP